MNYIRTKDTNQDIASGSIIMFNNDPDTRWIIEYGPYMVQSKPSSGWHATALPSGAVLPIDEETFQGVTLISSGSSTGGGGCCPCPPKPPCPPVPPCPPFPPAPPAPYFTAAPNMITVRNVEERDRIDPSLLMDGKVVRVNDYNGHPDYFEYDDETNSWKFINWGTSVVDKNDVDQAIDEAISWTRIGQDDNKEV